ncbi:hypothetical protein [uncultured Shimia sp.]|uniref:hypothetical protein n=1 Tax=uncultured Shimia sp. TaxID=573152 RepID=UPI00262CAD1B|nr:hypothetical protein [uncultured Shimia sp.]
MTRMEVTSTEHGHIRLFSVDLPSDDLAAFFTHSDQDVWPFRDALGAKQLDEGFTEYFDVADLEGLGLIGYMTEGLGIDEDEVDEDAQRLSSLSGHVVIVYSSAFCGVAQTLTPRAPLRWIGTYREDGASVSFAPLPSKAAKGILASGAPKHANAHLNVLLAILALPVLAAILATVYFLVRG